MEALELGQAGSARIVAVEQAAPGPGQVRLRVERVGICATDVHIFHDEFPIASFPLIPGHEFCGVVIEQGPGVTAPQLGQLVAVNPAMPCTTCIHCESGRTNLCANRLAHGVNATGALSEQIVVNATNCFGYTADISPEEAVLTEPLACVVHGISRAGGVAGKTVLVMGGGTIGILAAETARHDGAQAVTMAEISPARRALAEDHGFDLLAPDLAEAQSGGRQFDLVIDATGVAPVIEAGMGLLARGGTFLQLGVADPHSTVSLNPYLVFSNEYTIVGSLTTVGTFDQARDLIQKKVLNLSGIVGQPGRLDDFVSIVENFSAQPHLKSTISPNIRHN